MKIDAKLERLFQSIDLKFCDSPAENIINSPAMSEMIKIFPGWWTILKEGMKIDKEETQRTIRHVFRATWIYYALLNNKPEFEISEKYIQILQQELKNVRSEDSNLFPLLLLYHDIGRPFDREWHTIKSAEILVEKEDLFEIELSAEHKNILISSVRNHLLFGTIFTGESNYTGAISLLQDEEFIKIRFSSKLIKLYFQIQKLFTLVDIWGYDYSKIYDHYFVFYDEIQKELESAFNSAVTYGEGRALKKILSRFKKIDENNFKWRIACALRIFQFVDTDSHLTKSFYYNKIDEALESMGWKWHEFVEKLDEKHFFLQFKYSLPLLMVLASDSFKREPLKSREHVNPRLFRFWVQVAKLISTLENELKSTKIDSMDSLYFLVFKIQRGWFLKQNYLQHVRSHDFLNDLMKIKYSVEKRIQGVLLTHDIKI